jgi:hypothetical protein
MATMPTSVGRDMVQQVDRRCVTVASNSILKACASDNIRMVTQTVRCCCFGRTVLSSKVTRGVACILRPYGRAGVISRRDSARKRCVYCSVAALYQSSSQPAHTQIHDKTSSLIVYLRIDGYRLIQHQAKIYGNLLTGRHCTSLPYVTIVVNGINAGATFPL